MANKVPISRRHDRRCNALIRFVLGSALVCAIPASFSWAQTNPGAKPADQPAAAAGAADKAYTAGVKAFESGKVKNAVTSFSTALRQGGLPPDKMAKALYLRGSAYRKQKKPAQAISDLTSAIWIKGGLSDADRLAAMEQRNKAYTEAGLGTRAPSGLKPGGSVPSTAAAKPVAITPAPAPVAVPPPVASSRGTATSAWSTSAQTEQQAQTPPVQVAAAPATPPAAVPQSSSAPFSTLTPPIAPAPRPSTTLSAVPGAGPTSTPAQDATAPDAVGSTLSTIGSSVSQGVSNVGSFFSNMFAGATPTQPTTQVTTSSTTPSTSQSAQQPSASAPSLGWNATPAPAPQTAPRATNPPRPTRTAALRATPPPAPKPPATAPRAAGKFRLQVAAVRSQQKAQQMVAQLQSTYAAELAGVTPEIDAAAIGNMGTFYRVRVGPYVNTKVPQNLCAKLRNDGYDCLIVTP